MIGSFVGSYKITDKIGEGGMGAVFRGIDTMLEREVAIKMLRPELSRQPHIVERFRSEAVTLARLNHPNIATLYSFVRQGDDFFMVMEFVRGDTLETLIRRSGAMTCERAITLFCQALEGIDYAHRMEIIHRDIKPANMMLAETGTLKVMDFGIARVLGTARMTKQGNVVGTIEYMSPEQVRGQETDARSDIYSLGILLYEMLTGRVPFSSDSEYDLMKMQIEDLPETPRMFSPHISEAVELATLRALVKRPEGRFQTATEFRSALLIAVGAAAAPSVSATSSAARPARIEPVVAAALSPGAAPNEMRLASDDSVQSGRVGDQIKPTRMPGAGYYESAAPPPDSQSGSSSARQQYPKDTKAGNAKYFLLAAAVVLIVIVIGATLVASSRKEAQREREAHQLAELQRQEADRKIQEAEQKAEQERKTREAEELKRQQELEALRPSGKIEKVWADHNVVENGLMGMRIHFEFTIRNYKDTYCIANAFFYFASGKPLKDFNGSYKTDDGNVAVGKGFVPTDKDSTFSDFTLFMPYDELDMASGKYELKFDVKLQTRSGDPIAESDSVAFTITK